MSTVVFGSLMITYAVVQTVVFLLLIRLLDLYEREPLSAVALMTLWGSIGATTLSALGNGWVDGSLPAEIEIVFGAAVYAPAIEEVAKGLALVAFVGLSIWARGRYRIPHFGGVTDGIVYGAAIGLGFAFTEDILFLLLSASEEGLRSGFVDFLRRRDFFGLSMLQHAIYTASFGVGLGLATWRRSKGARVAFPAAGLAVAVLLHAINNGLVQMVLTVRYGLDATADYLSGTVPAGLAIRMDATSDSAERIVIGVQWMVIALFAAAIVAWLAYQRKVIREELDDETRIGLISTTELELLPSFWRRTSWYLQLVRSGQWERWRLLRRIHNELVTFAFLKRRTQDVGDDRDVQEARRLIAKLKAQKPVFVSPSRTGGATPRAAAEGEKVTARIDALARVEAFHDAPPESLRRLAATLEHRKVQPDEIVIRQGRIPSRFYIVADGELGVYSSGESGETVRVNTLVAGDYFGEIGLLEGIPSTATVRAERVCDLYFIPDAEFLGLVDLWPELFDRLLERVAGGLARTNPSYRPAAEARLDSGVSDVGPEMARIAARLGGLDPDRRREALSRIDEFLEEERSD